MNRLTSVVEEFVRSSQAQAKRRASPRSIGQRDPSLRWPHLYDILRAKGYSKEKAARIANSRLRYRKKGRLEGLPYKQADNPGALRKVLAEQNRKKKSRTASALVAACYDKSCAPPPAGTGGSKPGGSGKALSKGGGVKHDIITASEARGDSKPVSREEFQRLASIGQAKLDKMKKNASPTTGLDDLDNWQKLKNDTWSEVQNEWGGATIDAHTGQALPQGVNKYAMTVKDPGVNTLSIPIGSSQIAFRTAMEVAKQKFRPILEREGHHLGVFRDDDLGRIDFDPVIVVNNLSDVHTIGAATRAIGGAYNFADGNGYWPPHVKDS